MTMELITTVIVTIIAVVSALITTYLIPFIKSKTTQSQRELLVALARTAVYAAEQIFGAKTGEQKYDYVFDYLSQYVKFDKNTIRDAIESAVKEMNIEMALTSEEPQVDGEEV